MLDDQQFSFAYGPAGLIIEGKDGDDIVLEVPWDFLPAFVRIVTAFSLAHDDLSARASASR